MNTISLQAYKQNAHTYTVYYAFHTTPFGQCLAATLHDKVCYFAFTGEHTLEEALELLKKAWSGAIYVEEASKTEKIITTVFTSPLKKSITIPLTVKGTAFQIKVWNALLNLKQGETLSYENMAQRIGQPTATRATAHAIAKNTIAVLIPCHRVVKKSGAVHKYRWGTPIKKALLAWEAGQK